MDIDTQQLLYFSKHYLRLASRLKCPTEDLSTTIDQLYRDYSKNKGSNVYLLMAHLASAAYRAAALIDKHRSVLRSYNYRHVKNRSEAEIESELRSNLERYLPMLFRDLVGHDLQSPHYLATPRRNVLHELKPMECAAMVKRTILQIEKDLMANKLQSLSG